MSILLLNAWIWDPEDSKDNPELPPVKVAGIVTLVKLLDIVVFPPIPSVLFVKVIKKWPEELNEELIVNEFLWGPVLIASIMNQH